MVRVLIVDDESLARERIRRLLQAEPDVEIAGEAGNGPDAVNRILELRPDVVCLDIQMPGMDGFAVLREVGEANRPVVLFITAYDEHAQKAFDVHAVDYVLKPVDAVRFRTAFERARSRVTQAAAAERLGQLLDTVRMFSGETLQAVSPASSVSPAKPATGSSAYASRLLVKEDGRMFFVRTAEIDWIEADRNYVKLHVGKKVHTIRERMTHLEETLDPRVFARIHKSTIVNLNRIREMQQWFSGDYVVVLEDGTKLRLSRNYRERVEQRINE